MWTLLLTLATALCAYTTQCVVDTAFGSVLVFDCSAVLNLLTETLELCLFAKHFSKSDDVRIQNILEVQTKCSQLCNLCVRCVHVCVVYICALCTCVRCVYLCVVYMCPLCIFVRCVHVCVVYICALCTCVRCVHVCVVYMCALCTCVRCVHVCVVYMCPLCTCVRCVHVCVVYICPADANRTKIPWSFSRRCLKSSNRHTHRRPFGSLPARTKADQRFCP